MRKVPVSNPVLDQEAAELQRNRPVEKVMRLCVKSYPQQLLTFKIKGVFVSPVKGRSSPAESVPGQKPSGKTQIVGNIRQMICIVFLRPCVIG